MNNIIKDSKGIASSIILSVVAILVLILLGIPSLKSLRYQRQAADQAKYDYESGTKYISDIQNTYTSLVSSGLGKKLNIAAPADVDIPAALVQLDAIVSTAGLAMNTISPSTQNGQTNVNLVVTGEYSQLLNFLKLTETNLRPFNIQSVAIVSYEMDGKIVTTGTYDIVLARSVATQEVSTSNGSGVEVVTSEE